MPGSSAVHRPAGRRRRWSLRTRLLVSSISLIALVCAVVGVVTAVALQQELYGQLDRQLVGVADRAQHLHPPGGGVPDGGGSPPDPLDFVIAGGQGIGTLGAVVVDGQVVEAKVSTLSAQHQPTGVKLTGDAQKAALAAVPHDTAAHTVDIPGRGSYRVRWAGATLLVGQPTADQQQAMDRLIVAEICVSLGALVAAALAGTALTNSALRPLRRVAATAGRVSELRLDRGEVTLHERVPAADTDPRTEVGQVGAALNRLLGHVGSALEARQASETQVRQFVADASHELRTPLASIRGYAELTRRGREHIGSDTRHALGRIESEAARMTTLVEDLLLLARLDAGRPLSRVPLDVSPLVVDAVSDARAAGPGHRWRLDLPDDPAVVTGDHARLHQVLVNLLGNARNHTPPGTTVTVRVGFGPGQVLIDVVDDGPGIPAETLPHIFERFARGDASRSRHAGGTGLGLAIVQAVVTAHGGAVQVHSVPGQTVFRVVLPGTAAPRPEPAAHTHSRST